MRFKAASATANKGRIGMTVHCPTASVNESPVYTAHCATRYDSPQRSLTSSLSCRTIAVVDVGLADIDAHC